MAANNAHDIFAAYQGVASPQAMVRVQFRYVTSPSPARQVQALALRDNGTWAATSWYTLGSGEHTIELDWKAASSTSVHDGYLALWLDDALRASLASLDNDGKQVDSARLGAVSGVDSGTRGSYAFDAFDSRRASYIGLEGGERAMLLDAAALETSEIDLVESQALTDTLELVTLDDVEVTVSFDQPLLESWEGEVQTEALTGTLEIAGVVMAEETSADGGEWGSIDTIQYSYDPLYRLTGADYGDGSYFVYTYDSTGNRLSQEVCITAQCTPQITEYSYDDANRLATAGGVSYTWDDNGSLLNDGTYRYVYDHANRLTNVTDQQLNILRSYAYNGLGDRQRETASGQTTNYALDLENGLTQVLQDGTYTYLYGNGRIGQQAAGEMEYFLGDALGSVRQMTNVTTISLSKSYRPYGEPLATDGSGVSSYGFTGENTDNYIKLQYLRSRWYSMETGRFLTKDSWQGDYTKPISLNAWLYGFANPIRYTDPSGFEPCSLSYRYCILTGDTYRGAFIDVHHWEASYHLAENLFTDSENGLPSVIGKPFTPLVMHELLIERIPYQDTYFTNIPTGLSEETLRRIGLGIFMDFQFGLEGFEALDPVCWSLAGKLHPHRCSAFSNEDLPSDYLGFIAYVKYPGWSITDVAHKLGGGEGANDMLPENAGSWWDAYLCNVFGMCGDDNPYNKCWTFKVPDGNGKFIHMPWPSDLVIEPIGAGTYWAKTMSGFAQPVPTPPY